MNVAANRPSSNWWELGATRFVRQCAGAVGWGIFIAVAPFELVFGGWMVWLPLLIWRERVRTCRHGFWTGAIARFAIAFTIITIAGILPEHMDRIVGPLSYASLPLHDLCRELHRGYGIPVGATDESAMEERISFSIAGAISRREVVAQLAKATNREIRFAGCLNGSSVLCGVGGTYYLYPKKAHSKFASPLLAE